jgi:hypothetical protein
VSAAVLAASALYAVASALLFNLVLGPFAGPEYLEEALWSAVVVALPYVFAYFGYRLVRDDVSLWVFGVCLGCVVLLGGVLYSGGFTPNDGEYALVFFLTPLLQLPFVVLTVGVSLWRRRFRPAAGATYIVAPRAYGGGEGP